MEYIPKNIRQIGDREDRIRVYMEDYVSTYLRKIQQLQEENGVAGLLVGDWQKTKEQPCVFISGAMAVRQASLEGGQVQFSQKAWDEGYEALGTYFSGQELCGFFVCEGNRRRFRRQALFAAVRESFPHQEALLYLLTEDGEEIVYRIRPQGEERLQGYYCYFERNEAMQDYMMDQLPERRVEWERSQARAPLSLREKEGTLGGTEDPALRFRKKMEKTEKHKGKAAVKNGRGNAVLCAAMALVIVVCGMGLAYRERGGVQMRDLLSRLHIDPGLLAAVSAIPEETGEHYVGRENGQNQEGGGENLSPGILVEEIPGQVYPTEEVDRREEETASIESDPKITEPETTEPEITETETSEPETTEPESIQSVEPSKEEGAFSVGTGVLYTVREGDSLYSISRRFYGTEEMAKVIQQLNDLENADLIKVGQELLLP